MLEDYNPYKYLRQAQTAKFKELLFPILLILVSFLLSYFLETDLLIFLSLSGFLGYIIISIRYRIHRVIPLEIDSKFILAPINSRVAEIAGNKVKLRKKWYYTCDFRTAAAFKLKLNLTATKSVWFELENTLPGKLVGIVPRPAICELEIPDGFQIKIKKGDKLIAGESVIASIPEN
jgi:hypothetical protein